MRVLSLSVISAVLISACAAPINQRNASNYYDMGLQAEQAGNYVLAEQNYDRALINARLGSAPDTGISAAMYSLGRMKGLLCKYDDAEKLLVEALALEEKATGQDSVNTSKRLFELSRLYFDQGQYTKSLPYFQRAVPAARKLGVESSDPIAFANILDEYVIALEKTGNKVLATSTRESSAALRTANSGKSAKFLPKRYNQSCPKPNA